MVSVPFRVVPPAYCGEIFSTQAASIFAASMMPRIGQEQLLCRKNGALQIFAKRRQAATGLREGHGRPQRGEALRMV